MSEKLDLKDKKILFELDKNSRINLPELSRKTRISKEVLFHRINNLIKRGFILRFQTILSTYRLGYRSYKFYFKLQNTNKEIKDKIQNFFMDSKEVYWIGNCQGKWDLIVAFWARDIKQVGEFEDEILNKFSKYIQERAFTISRKSTQYNRRWFYDDKKEVKETDFGENEKKVEIDDLDLKILNSLSTNSRIKIIELVDKTKTSVNTIRYRLKNLEEKRIIVGYKIALNSKLLNHETCKSFISLKNIDEKKMKELINYCKNHINIINYVLTIGPWDLEIEMEVKNFEEYYSIMNEMQEKFQDIISSYDSVLFSSEPKQEFVPEI